MPTGLPHRPRATVHSGRRTLAPADTIDHGVGTVVVAALAGDAAAWTKLIERYDGMLRSIARSFALGPADVDDAVQSTWLQLITSIDRVREPAAVQAGSRRRHAASACGASRPRFMTSFQTMPQVGDGWAKWALPSDTQQFVAGYMDVFTNATPGGRKAALVGAGKALFRATPPELQTAFWRLADRLETILVVTAEPYLPWELMIPARGTEVRRPLGVEYSVGRWVLVRRT
jgi:hypothetical protein